ncbi:MAG: VWA domain-containing protein [Gemmatimonadetes bacterium]|nr:VWA domain-containing protein [Gemmatimonadota bacterium]
MGFLAPWALLALPLAGLPLLLHLLQRRDPPTVAFPAVRYLVQVTQEHNRRLKLRHWLLLLVRTLLVLALVLAAARPSAPLAEAPSHGPSALVLILDNSPSSTAVAAGTTRLVELKAAARRILERATPADALWLLAADGVARRGTAPELTRLVDSLEGSSRRLDLGQAIVLAGEVLRTDDRPGGIVVVSDLQATALSAATPTAPLLVAGPTDEPPPNQGVVAVDPGAQPWTPEGGKASAGIAGDATAPAPVSMLVGNRPARQALVPAGGSGSFTLGPLVPGWHELVASKTPDELRADDDRVALVRVAPVASALWDPADRYLAAAAEVLVAAGRLRRGAELALGTLGNGASVVLPPEDPAQLGALNRALERRGVAWRFGAPAPSAVMTDSSALLPRVAVRRRFLLEPMRAGQDAGVVARAGGQPWIVRDGAVVLVGSRLDAAWTDLPLTAAFVPLVDALVNRVARGDLALAVAAPGDPVAVPDLATQVVRGTERWPVEGGATFRPPERGAYFILAGNDTIGGISVNLDPRESALAPAEPSALRALWPGARVVALAAAPGAAFAGAGQASLQAPLLWLALLLGLTEVGLASGRKQGA